MKRVGFGYPALLLSLAATALLTVCSKDSRSPTEIVAKAQKIRLVSGDAQSGRALARLAEPLTVQVLDDEGNPVPAYTVRFDVTSASGYFYGSNTRSTEVVTNSSGLTSVYLTLGASAEISYTVQASAVRSNGAALQGSPVTFTASAVSSADTTSGGTGGVPSISTAFSISGIELGADTIGATGRYFKIPLNVHVVDSLGEPVGGLKVFFNPVQGGGVFDIPEQSTDGNGNATNQVRLGYQEGLNLIQASAVLPDGSVLVHSWRIWARLDPDVRHNAFDIFLPENQPDSLSAPVGSTLPLPLIVTVVDTFGHGSPGQSVTWTIENGGSIGSSVTTTNSEGIAQVTITLDPNPGLNRVKATIIRDSGEARSIYIDIWGLALETPEPAPDQIAVLSGGDQTAEVNQVLPLPVTLTVLDSSGKRLPAVDVKLTVTTPLSEPATSRGFIGEESQDIPYAQVLNLKSDDDGLVVFIWQLGPGPELENTVLAEIRLRDGTLRTLTVRAQAMPSPDRANRLVILSGNYQDPIAVNSLLPLPLVVRVVDTTRTGVNGDTIGAPISNFPVLMTAYSPSGDGFVEAQPGSGPNGTGRLTTLTDNDGLASVRWTTGTLTGAADDLNLLRHNNRVVAVAVFADGSQDSVVFFTTAVPLAAAAMTVSGTTELTGTAGKSLPLPTVTVTDKYGNVVQGAGIYFSIGQTPGSAQIAQPNLSTDIYGNVSGIVDQLSTKSGAMSVSASNGSLNGSPINFSITVGADAATSIQIAGGDGQTAKQGTAWTNAIKVLVLDQYGNAKPEQLVRFSVNPAGAAAIKDLTVFTDADGIAETTAAPNITGAVSITATTSIGGVNTSVNFSLTATAP